MAELSDPRGIWVKVCGLTRGDDVQVAAEAGASAVGFVFASSPRRVTIEQAHTLRRLVPAGVLAFGVFGPDESAIVAEAAAQLRLDGVQLPTMAPPLTRGTIVLRTVRLRSADDLLGLAHVPCDAVHIDAYVEDALGGTGTQAPWHVLEKYRPRKPFVLAGGLDAQNVADAIRRTVPLGVDVSSGVESSPGVKDPQKVRAFVDAARRAASGAR